MAQTTLIVLMSPAGGAKGVIANYLKNNKEDCIVISRKQMEHGGATAADFYDAINRSIGVHKHVVINDYNTTVEDRAKLFYNIRFIGTEVIGIWIGVPTKLALKNNKVKDKIDQVDEDLITSMVDNAVSPTKKEPFSQVIYITKNSVSTGIGTSTANPKIEDMYHVLDKI